MLENELTFVKDTCLLGFFNVVNVVNKYGVSIILWDISILGIVFQNFLESRKGGGTVNTFDGGKQIV